MHKHTPLDIQSKWKFIMICPQCKSEFVDGITICSDCRIPLVIQIADQSVENSEPEEISDFICVYTPINSQEVALIKMIMEREAIPYFIKNDPIHKAVLFSVHGPGNIELYVTEQYAEDVIKLLKDELGHD